MRGKGEEENGAARVMLEGWRVGIKAWGTVKVGAVDDEDDGDGF